jgi:hypothetical protein
MKPKYIALIWFAVSCLGGLVWFFAITGVVHTCPLLSPTELQERVGVEPDGKIGPETMEAWDRVYCEEQGIKSCEPFVGDDGKLHFYDER